MAHFHMLGLISMEHGRVGDGLPQGERGGNPTGRQACTHTHYYMIFLHAHKLIHASSRKVLALPPLPPFHTSVSTQTVTQPTTLFAVSYDGPKLSMASPKHSTLKASFAPFPPLVSLEAAQLHIHSIHFFLPSLRQCIKHARHQSRHFRSFLDCISFCSKGHQ